jgi:hypothetical protein
MSDLRQYTVDMYTVVSINNTVEYAQETKNRVILLFFNWLLANIGKGSICHTESAILRDTGGGGGLS